MLAFFPCTRFEARVPLWFRGEAQQQKNWTIYQKLEYSMNLHEELHEFYLLISKMVYIAKKKGLNPLSNSSRYGKGKTWGFTFSAQPKAQARPSLHHASVMSS